MELTREDVEFKAGEIVAGTSRRRSRHEQRLANSFAPALRRDRAR